MPAFQTLQDVGPPLSRSFFDGRPPPLKSRPPLGISESNSRCATDGTLEIAAVYGLIVQVPYALGIMAGMKPSFTLRDLFWLTLI